MMIDKISQLSILILDNTETAAKLYASTLQSKGYQVEIMTQGATVLPYLETHTPNVLVVDLYMVFISGTSLLAHIQNLTHLKDMKTVLLTTDLRLGQQLAHLVNCVVKRPITAAALAQKIQDLL